MTARDTEVEGGYVKGGRNALTNGWRSPAVVINAAQLSLTRLRRRASLISSSPCSRRGRRCRPLRRATIVFVVIFVVNMQPLSLSSDRSLGRLHRRRFVVAVVVRVASCCGSGGCRQLAGCASHNFEGVQQMSRRGGLRARGRETAGVVSCI